MNSVHEWATYYASKGLSPTPVKADGLKMSALTAGVIQQYRDRIARPDELAKWFAGTPFGVGIIGGTASGNLAVFDIETDHQWLLFQLRCIAKGIAHFFDGCPTIKTPGGGRHVYCRIAEGWVATNKLALDVAGKTLIEIRGHGSYVLAPGSHPWCHKKNAPYLIETPGWLEGPNKTMTFLEFGQLCEAAREFNKYVRPVVEYVAPKNPQSFGSRIGDEFNGKADWFDILGPHGWVVVFQCDGVTYWRRPGKKEGHSATTGHCFSKSTGASLLKVFSTNAAPLMDKSYDKFGAYTVLNHSGNFSASAKQLAFEGYGKSPQSNHHQDDRHCVGSKSVHKALRREVASVGVLEPSAPSGHKDTPVTRMPIMATSLVDTFFFRERSLDWSRLELGKKDTDHKLSGFNLARLLKGQGNVDVAVVAEYMASLGMSEAEAGRVAAGKVSAIRHEDRIGMLGMCSALAQAQPIEVELKKKHEKYRPLLSLIYYMHRALGCRPVTMSGLVAGNFLAGNDSDKAEATVEKNGRRVLDRLEALGLISTHEDRFPAKQVKKGTVKDPVKQYTTTLRPEDVAPWTLPAT